MGRRTGRVIDRCVLAFLLTVLAAARSALRSRGMLALENLALRQELAVLQRNRPRPQLDWTDRVFGVALSRTWSRWRDTLLIVKPATVVRWHHWAFRRFWTWRSRRPPGRPPIDAAPATSSARSRSPTQCGAPRASMTRCSSSASKMLRRRIACRVIA
jgi:hypothetical protein